MQVLLPDSRYGLTVQASEGGAFSLGDRLRGSARPPRTAILVLVLAWIGVHLVFSGAARFRVPLHPFLILGAVNSPHAFFFALNLPAGASLAAIGIVPLSGGENICGGMTQQASPLTFRAISPATPPGMPRFLRFSQATRLSCRSRRTPAAAINGTRGRGVSYLFHYI